MEAAVEMSKRGGHLWIFMERPALARECRIYIYNLALKLGVGMRGAGLAEGDFATLIWPTLRFSFGPPWKTKTA